MKNQVKYRVIMAGIEYCPVRDNMFLADEKPKKYRCPFRDYMK